MKHLLLIAALFAQAPETKSMVGTVLVLGPAQTRRIVVRNDTGDLFVTGNMAEEVAALQSATVEVIGKMKGDALDVMEYRIVSLGAIGKPLVGVLVRSGPSLALSDGTNDPVFLNCGSKVRVKLEELIGAKMWVVGKRLETGEIKIQRYGVLRRAAIDVKKEPQK